MIRFNLNGAAHEATDVSPTTTMLDYLRDILGMTGTKEGCAEGDCGACTVVRVIDGRFEAVNSCLIQVGQADGVEILTVEGLEEINGGALTPVQDAMATGDGDSSESDVLHHFCEVINDVIIENKVLVSAN